MLVLLLTFNFFVKGRMTVTWLLFFLQICATVPPTVIGLPSTLTIGTIVAAMKATMEVAIDRKKQVPSLGFLQ